MRLLTVCFVLCLSLLFIQDTQAQIFLRKAGGGYSKTVNGYFYKGREYIRGRDLPDNPNCPCPMCVDLVKAYKLAHIVTSFSSEPLLVSDSASTKLIGTPEDAIPSVLKIFKQKFKDNPNFRLLDPGCGDARLLIYAVKTYGIEGVGIEINPETYRIAKQKVKDAGLEGRITIILADSRTLEFDKVDGIVMFLFPDLITDLTKKFDELKSGARVVSYSHDIPIDGTVRCEDCYVWDKPQCLTKIVLSIVAFVTVLLTVTFVVIEPATVLSVQIVNRFGFGSGRGSTNKTLTKKY